VTPRDRDLVWSSDGGRVGPAADGPAAPRSGAVRVGRETKGRKGKGVTVVTGLPLDAAGLAELAQALKRRCGSGGTVKDGVIELQGDHREAVTEELRRRGWDAKRSGG
jgi:translation initiation factor 1